MHSQGCERELGATTQKSGLRNGARPPGVQQRNLGSLTKEVRSQLDQMRNPMTQPSVQAQAGQTHAERVRLQMVAIGHTAYTLRAWTSKAQALMAAQIANRSSITERMPNTGSSPSATPMEHVGGAAAGMAPKAPRVANQAGPRILRTSAHVVGDRQQVQDRSEETLQARTSMRPSSFRVAVLASGRALVSRIASPHRDPACKVEYFIGELRDRQSQWRELDISVAVGRKTGL